MATNTDRSAALTALPSAKRRRRKLTATGLTVFACGSSGVSLCPACISACLLGVPSELRTAKAKAPGSTEFPEVIVGYDAEHFRTLLVQLEAEHSFSRRLDGVTLQDAHARMLNLCQICLRSTRLEKLGEAAKLYWLREAPITYADAVPVLGRATEILSTGSLVQ